MTDSSAVPATTDRDCDDAMREVERLSALIAACPQGVEGHACCDCPTQREADLERRLRALEKAQPIVRLR